MATHVAVNKRRLIVVHERGREMALHSRDGFNPVVFIRKELVDDMERALYAAREAIRAEWPEDDLLATIDRALSRYPFHETD